MSTGVTDALASPLIYEAFKDIKWQAQLWQAQLPFPEFVEDDRQERKTEKRFFWGPLPFEFECARELCKGVYHSIKNKLQKERK